MKRAVFELDLGYEIVYLNGYLVADDYLVVIEEDVMWMYHVREKEGTDVYVTTKAGLWLGEVKRKEADEPALISRVLDFMQKLSFSDFIRHYHDWSVDYNFEFVEAVS